MAKKKKTWQPQVAALPVRTGFDGKTQVLVITSRETGRWVLPKGWPMEGRKDPHAALIEAFEEAGVKGKVSKHASGTYDYVKVMPKGKADIDVRVTVYLMDVTDELKRWPERDERTRDWVSAIEAADRVDEPELKKIILSLSKPQKLAS